MPGSVAATEAGGAFVRIWADDSALARGLRRAEARVRMFGASVQAVGRTMVGFGVAAAAPFALSSKSFADFESAMARVKALKSPTEQQFKDLSALAKKLGADTIFSAAQAAEAMAKFAEKGYSVGQIMKAVGPTLDLAATAQIDLADAAGIASDIMKGMGIDASRLGEVVDVLAKASTTAGNSSIPLLGEALSYVGPLAHTAGVSLEEVTAAIQVLSDAGIKGEMAGTTLRGMLTSLTNPSKEAADELHRLGVRVADGRKNFVGFVSIVGQLQAKLAGRGNVEQLESLGKIFPTRAAAGAATLVAKGADKIRAGMDALKGSAGTAARVAGIQMDTLKGDFDVLTSSVEGVGIEIGGALSPTIRRWGRSLAEAANVLALVVKNNQGLVVGAAKGVVVVAGLGAGMFALGVAAKGLAVGLAVARIAVSATTGVVLGLHAAFKALQVTISIGSILSSLGATLAAVATPAGLLTAAVLALVGGIAYLAVSSGALSAAFGSISKTAVSAFGSIAEALKSGDIATAGQVFWAALKVEWLKGVLYLETLWADWSTATVEVFREASYAISSAITDAWAAVRSATNATLGWLEGGWIDLVSKLQVAWVRFVGFVKFNARLIRDYLSGTFLFSGAAHGRLLEETRKEVEAQVEQIQKDALARQVGSEQGRKAAGERIESERADAQRALLGQQEAEEERRRADAREGLAQATRDLAAAEVELKALQGKAGEATADAEARDFLGQLDQRLRGATEEGRRGRGGGGLPSAEDLEAGLSKAASTVDVVGTFSASALRGLGAGESVTDAVKEGNKELKKLNDKARRGRLVFTS